MGHINDQDIHGKLIDGKSINGDTDGNRSKDGQSIWMASGYHILITIHIDG